ncbi:Fur-regulated basic protein FbpA [Bacillus sp. V3-13]|uniref:Fur-regulated basic protein FbpA n=1 Tax=Bacillus sp. V3-13 TaxID=2053728 RepID=UPI000C78F851|nr:Fur-regulated basic protein FbpA [Bacillus sp. V3-13]PLR76622.1 Fur-regulated basic protein FbpA [Bacillus sp. V3-13]
MKNIDFSAEEKKEFFIAKLLDLGVYKKGDRQLFELSLDDLTEEYEKIMKCKNFKNKKRESSLSDVAYKI